MVIVSGFCHQIRDCEFRERVGFPTHVLCHLTLLLTKHIREETNMDLFGGWGCAEWLCLLLVPFH